MRSCYGGGGSDEATHLAQLPIQLKPRDLAAAILVELAEDEVELAVAHVPKAEGTHGAAEFGGVDQPIAILIPRSEDLLDPRD